MSINFTPGILFPKMGMLWLGLNHINSNPKHTAYTMERAIVYSQLANCNVDCTYRYTWPSFLLSVNCALTYTEDLSSPIHELMT